MPKVYIDGVAVDLNTSDVLGKGGEADIYKLPNSRVAKLYKPPNHPDYLGLPVEQQGAKARIIEQQFKLLDFPNNLPSNVVKPEKLIRSGVTNNSKIVGYVMSNIVGAEELKRYSDKSFRMAGIDPNDVIDLFRNIHKLVDNIHLVNTVIGDFSDLNVLVKSNVNPYLIDADSMQYGNYLCKTFTNRFADPLKCGFNSSGDIVLTSPHDENSDWFAYAVMLMQCILYVDPYGGIYRPSDKTKRTAHSHRPMRKITVFDHEVIYPKPAIPYKFLPDELVSKFIKIFSEDERGVFPYKLLEDLRWTTCIKCGTEHANNICPNCLLGPQTKPKEVVVIRGEVTATRIFKSDGIILHAVMEDKIRWLEHVDNKFIRENRDIVSVGSTRPNMRYRLTQNKTVMALNESMIVLSDESPLKYQLDKFGSYPIIDANSKNYYWMQNGALYKNGPLNSKEYIGSVLSDHTVFWVGETFGLGFYRAGEINVGFVFGNKSKSLKDDVKLNLGSGQMVDATCYFSSTLAWLLTCTNEAGKLINRCQVVDSKGSIVAIHETEAGSDNWLGNLRAKTAAGNLMFAATDEGICRVEINGKALEVTRKFPDTESFVDSSCRLLIGSDGLYVVTDKEITRLRIG
jgi:hypothetical protein